MPTVTVGGVGWSVVRLFFGTIPSSPLWIYHHLYTAVLTVAPVAPQSTYNHRYCRCCQIITTPGNPPLKYCTIQFWWKSFRAEIIFSQWMMVKQTTPQILFHPHTQGMARNLLLQNSTPIIISTAILARQVKVIDESGDILIIVGFHNNFLLENVLSHPQIWLKYYNWWSM